MTIRGSVEVTRRAIVMGAVAFRASLEATKDQRAPALAPLLPKWLMSQGLNDALDPIERELLNTPYGKLDESQRIDANWSGEGAALFCWTLGLGERPPTFGIADQAAAINALHILRPEVNEILAAPALRSTVELVDSCKTIRLTRVMLREDHVRRLTLDDDEQEKAISLTRKMVREELASVGVEIADDDFQEIAQAVASAPPDQRNHLAAAYLARDVAITWLFDDRPTYFEQCTA